MDKTRITKVATLIVFFCILTFSGSAKSNVVQEINRIETPSVSLAPLRFLASDELKGRATDRPEINIAARYISEELRSIQLKECPGTDDYFQNFDIKMITPAQTGTLIIGDHTFKLGEEMIELNGADANLDKPLVYAGYGSTEDFDRVDVKGKIVITLSLMLISFSLLKSLSVRISDSFAAPAMDARLPRLITILPGSFSFG